MRLRIARDAKRGNKRTPRRQQLTNPGKTDLEDIERRARLFRAVDKLPEDQRRVILLRFADEKSVRDIASELGRTEGAVKQLQFRGLENLRARLSDKF